ncbi:RNA polymerase subunit sigma-24 [Marinobacterium zhoushanense]|uniref:RNA polymerase subunit sigma-24 n=1 Tax=Marinobacterium zhoushanense TaxID=1679163 RepID=A0ABQ1KCR9_9GAMM|nr:sigma-70 family RNA polymerase sigma factor [Marinobacterium zhoushanense]GGB95788.1 RNA polymerase subunit sigma-24 [Marinobacterium zhoushanense]
MTSALEAFQKHRSSLFALAYRMLGSKQDAEDILQDAFLKFQSVSIDSLESSQAYLITLVSRQCIDALRRARYREGYEGPWLPEPLVEETVLQACPSELTHRYQQVSQGVLWMMEALSPTQRAVLVLRDVLDLPYERIADIVEKSIDNCRQIYRRACQKMELSTGERSSTLAVNQYWMEQLLSALVNADTQALLKLLHEDASLVSDGGGKAVALSKPLHGRDCILTFLAGLQHYYRDDEVHFRTANINNEPGILIYVNREPVTTCTLIRQGEQIRHLLMVRNPDKLRTARREMV